MTRPTHKSADEPLVDDADEAMRKTILATRQALAVPKPKIDAMLAREKGNRDARRKPGRIKTQARAGRF